MKKLIITIAVLSTAALSSISAQAADRKVMVPIATAMADSRVAEGLDSSIKLYFGNQHTPKVLQKFGNDKTSKKTNAFGKSDESACSWVFLSAMLQLQQRARELGANAVVNITSNYKNIPYSSATDFECHVGAIMAGTAFKADFVKIAP